MLMNMQSDLLTEAFEQDLAPNAWPVPNFDDAPTAAEWDALDDLACAGAFEHLDGTPAPAPTAHDHVGCMTFEGTHSFCDKAKGGCGQAWDVTTGKRGLAWVAEGQEGNR